MIKQKYISSESFFSIKINNIVIFAFLKTNERTCFVADNIISIIPIHLIASLIIKYNPPPYSNYNKITFL